uniref:Lipocalin/cytosolic fatty-acid binding domain-containing protein n=1 Tax=Amblyomma maculatum TaxID=34609 RepID=G3MRB4_AMBMU
MYIATWFLLEISIYHHAIGLVMPPWAKEDKFGKHQDAWQTLDHCYRTPYYLVKSTTPMNYYLYNSNTTCVKLKAIKIYSTNKTAQLRFTYEKSGRRYRADIDVQAERRYGYRRTYNVIEFLRRGGLWFSEEIIFTYRLECALFNFPFRGNRHGCELWVAENNIKDIPDICIFMFDYICQQYTSVNVYSSTCTNNVRRP